MLSQIYAIFIKELKLLWKDREALTLLFAMPAFFILVMSFALETVFEAGTAQHPLEILVINEDRGPLAQEAIDDLRRIETLSLIETQDGAVLTLAKAERLIHQEEYSLALHFKDCFSEQMQKISSEGSSSSPSVSLISDPVINKQILASVGGAIQGVLDRRLLMIRLPRMLQDQFSAEMESRVPKSLAAFQKNGFDPERLMARLNQDLEAGNRLVLQVTSPRSMKKTRRPTSTEQNVPGYTIFGVFFIVLTLASGFMQEKRDGTFQRILTAPVSKTSILVGKLLPFYVVNLVQIAIMFFIGVIVFQMDLGYIPALILISMALSAVASGMGLFVAAVCRTEAQVNGLSVLLAITLAALGGMMVPAYLMPGFMKTLSLFTPHAWALEGYQDVMIRGLGIWAILPETGILLLFAALFFGIALWRFRFDG
jgi:ABC-2 type transport system permease protein